MNDFDFLKEFGKNLHQERPHDPTDAEWSTLATALEMRDRQKRRRRLLFAWAFPVAASALLAILGTLLWQTRTRADAMQSEIVQLRQLLNAKNAVVTTDTTRHHVTTIQYDTIYRTVVMRTYMPGFESGTMAQNPVRSLSQIPSIENKLEGNSINTLVTQNQTVSAKEAPENQQVKAALAVEANGLASSISENKNSILNSNLAILKPKDIKPLRREQTDPKPEIYKLAVETKPVPAPHVPLIRRLHPHDAMIGLMGGVLFPQTGHAESGDNYTVGLNGQLAFGRHWRLLGGADYGWTNFRVKGNALNASDIPALNPPTINDVLTRVDVKQPLWDFSIGLRYDFLPKHRLSPFVDAAWLGEQTQEQTLEYEFRNTVTQSEPYVLLVPRNNSRFNANGLQIGLGVNCLLTRQFAVELGGIYQRQYASSVPLLGERWGAKGGLLYRF